MAKDTQEQNIKDLSSEELNLRIHEAREKLFNLKFSNKTAKLKNPLEIRKIRREIARLLTAAKAKK